MSTQLNQLTEHTLAIFELLVWWNAFLVLDLGLDDADGLGIKGDLLPVLKHQLLLIWWNAFLSRILALTLSML